MTEFDVTFRDDREWVSFGESYVSSEAFKTLFREGMLLVEETAAYLDGEGRAESRLISRDATLAYASESMRLTTRLMQIASWLLVQRAVSEGEISLSQAQEEKTRVKLAESERTLPEAGDTFAELPLRLQDLVRRSRRLHSRILHLDALISEDRPAPVPRESPVTAQFGRLQAAFGGK
ncbi:protease adaptor protein RcdA [Methylorubrum thiocyanatum]|uniref:protease adaptor protein RcdA n=1 Tax=Methylorubrum thiocyanatum TaxID=47958 RepID=UPI0035C81E90